MAIATVTSTTKYQRSSMPVRGTLPSLSVIAMLMFLPIQMEERDPLPRHVSCKHYVAIHHIQPLGRCEELKLACGLKVSILPGSRMLGGTHALPRRVGVAVHIINAIMLQKHAANASWNSPY